MRPRKSPPKIVIKTGAVMSSKDAGQEILRAIRKSQERFPMADKTDKSTQLRKIELLSAINRLIADGDYGDVADEALLAALYSWTSYVGRRHNLGITTVGE